MKSSIRDADAEKTIDRLKGELTDWHNVVDRHWHEADALKATAKERKPCSGPEEKKRQDTETELAGYEKKASFLEAEVEKLRKVELDLKGRLSHSGKELEATKGALEDAKREYHEVSDVVAPLVDALAPKPKPVSHEILIASLQESVGGLKEYICSLVSMCATHILSLVKAFYTGQDTKPFFKGRVENVPDSEYPALEEQVKDTVEAILNGLEF